ncbi:ATP-binding cassette domain-containing protein [Agromyces sp. NPDC056523]|uniref:ATP-binding cassette domain-containing protein n=1 Tax=Agromyces sp. NPDC056523 TaxID=3345850 RepID=UPI00366C6898
MLREAYLKLRRGDRVGLMGKNGTGKTTFLELVLGRREPSGGTVDVTLGTTIGYFSEFSELDGEQSTYATLSAHFTEVHETQARLDEIGHALVEPMTDAAPRADRVADREREPDEEHAEAGEPADGLAEVVVDQGDERDRRLDTEANARIGEEDHKKVIATMVGPTFRCPRSTSRWAAIGAGPGCGDPFRFRDGGEVVAALRVMNRPGSGGGIDLTKG